VKTLRLAFINADAWKAHHAPPAWPCSTHFLAAAQMSIEARIKKRPDGCFIGG